MAAKPVVAGTDGSEESLRAVDWAAREAVLRGLPLRIVSAAALLPRMAERQRQAVSGLDTVSDTSRRNRDRALAVAAERAAAAAADLLIDVDALDGASAYALDRGRIGSVDASRGRPRYRYVHRDGPRLGEPVRIRACDLPVVVVREETTAAHRQVGVGIGDPSRSDAALAFAFEEAALRKASLIAVHAWDSPHGQIAEEAARQLESVLAEWQAKYPDVQVSHDFVHAHPGRALVGLSARADLVVLGRHTTHGALPGPGAARHAVLNHAHGPVVTVPSS